MTEELTPTTAGWAPTSDWLSRVWKEHGHVWEKGRRSDILRVVFESYIALLKDMEDSAVVEDDVTLNDRGFKVYGRVTDSRGCEVRVQESSVVGRPHVYVFTKDVQGAYKGSEPSPHLSVEQAEQLKFVLERFIKDAKSASNWRNSSEYKEMFG